VAAALAEGRVAIIVDGSPMVLLIPGSFTAYLNTPEDYYERFPYGSLMRVIRIGAAVIALVLPSLYIAITTFHQEMLPTTLLMAFASSREPVPFPALLEAALMMLALELVREAGLRLPAPVGQTVGIVAALLLGQAAVQAGLASPVLVIVVAITGLCSFVVPHYASGLPLRWLSFPLMILSGLLGLFGLTAGLIALALHLSGLTSLGVPYLEPIWRPHSLSRDTFIRTPLWTMLTRPQYLKPLDPVRQEVIVRDWVDASDEKGGDEN
jgi:spore germination protein KA